MAAVTNALRQRDREGEYAGRDPVGDVGSAEHTLRYDSPGNPVPWRGIIGRLASVSRPHCDRKCLVWCGSKPLSKNHRDNGLSNNFP